MVKKIGYARVSTIGQELNLQIDSLIKEGVLKDDLYIDKISGAKKERPGLDKCLKSLKEGDTLIVWRLDRLGRSISHLVSIIESLRERGVLFKSVCDGVMDTTTASGELVFNIFSCMAQFERRLIQERTKAGLQAARARGRLGGRPSISPDNKKVIIAKKMHANKTIPLKDILETLNISHSTLYRYLAM